MRPHASEDPTQDIRGQGKNELRAPTRLPGPVIRHLPSGPRVERPAAPRVERSEGLRRGEKMGEHETRVARALRAWRRREGSRLAWALHPGDESASRQKHQEQHLAAAADHRHRSRRLSEAGHHGHHGRKHRDHIVVYISQ